MKISVYRKGNELKCKVPGYHEKISFYEFAAAVELMTVEEWIERFGEDVPTLTPAFTLNGADRESVARTQRQLILKYQQK